MTKIITVANQKGGVGKTTLTCNLAVAASQEGLNVLILDADRQASSMEFRTFRQERAEKDDIAAFPAREKAMFIDSSKLQKGFDIVFIDVGGHSDGLFKSCIFAARDGWVLLPFKGSELDLRSTQTTVEIIQEARELGVTIPAYVVLNMAKPNTLITKQIHDIMEEYAPGKDVEYLSCQIGERTVFDQAFSAGLGVIEYDPNSKAAFEIPLC